MNSEKMNGLRDRIAIFSRLKKITLHKYEKMEQLREMILDIQDIIRNLMEFRMGNQDNRFLEITIRDAARIQSRLVSKYTRPYGEFPFTVVEEKYLAIFCRPHLPLLLVHPLQPL